MHNTRDTPSERQLGEALQHQQLSTGIRYQLQARRRQALAGQGAKRAKLAIWTTRQWGTMLGGIATVALISALALMPREPGFDLAQVPPEVLVDPLLLEEMDMLLWLSELPEDAI